MLEKKVVQLFRPRYNTIIPNVSWGFLEHEADLLVVTKAGYIYEIELKVSKADLLAEARKRHTHGDYRNRIKFLFFAMPHALVETALKFLPANVGIIDGEGYYTDNGFGGKVWHKPKVVRPAKSMSTYKATTEDRMQLLRLGSLRVWNLKAKLARLMAPGKRG